ncbi:YcxB family protein [Shewanella sp. 5_MG-2023]|uniref:YcxB family protein n=1 Tax=Shewanella sp. 5_MG-2023 TaxID=3062656 RepID=UPI0026E3B95E|nr:YcxB family protein [Shewanella sp. 5_MG-2023]MDO6638866.1 YcxB family protein [Shewanella sp. 5_MG-2023]
MSTSETKTTTYSYSVEYILDRSHFEETFDESVVINTSPKRYLKSVAFLVAGFLMTITELSPYVAYFFIGLGAVEALQVRFNRAWWLMRQLISKSANNPVNLTIDDNGIHSKSTYIDHHLAWDDVYRIAETSQGFLLTTQLTKHYVSKRCLDDTCSDFIRKKMN